MLATPATATVSFWLYVSALIGVLAVAGFAAFLIADRGRHRRALRLPAVGVYPGSRDQAGDLCMAEWRGLSTARQAAVDRAAVAAADVARVDAQDAAWQAADRTRPDGV